VLLYALATLVLYQWQVLSYVIGAIDLGSVQGLAILGTLQAVQFFLIVGLMLVLGFVSIWLMKIAGAVLFIANALAQYFMSTYGTVIDPSMIGNILNNRVPTPLPDGTLTPPADNLRDVVVLVIGEAARGDHLAALGYDRETTPFTEPLDVVAYPGGRSCVTYTVGALRCILSFKGNEAEATDPFEPLPSYLNRTGVDTIVRENNAGLPPLPGVTIQTVDEVNAPCEGECPDRWYDDQLLTGLSQQIAASPAQTVFVLLHLAGSHGPEYFRRYPPEFQAFAPVCQTTLVADCTREELVNAYDNSIRYTDYTLSQLIGQLQALPDTRATMLYVADHGQALGENGIYLHGLPNSMAPESQRRIPLMLWFDDEVAQARGLDRAAMSRPIENPQDMIFHTVLGALRVQSPIYRPEYDLFQLGQGGREP
jgi:lipid A ethanolaminephosphotransferase